MSLDDLKIGELKKLCDLFTKGGGDHPYEIGAAYLIRTVTMYYTGRLTWVGEHELVLDEAAWVADTGRYHEALETGKLNEVEPIKGKAIIGRGAICDAVRWPNNIPLPRDVK